MVNKLEDHVHQLLETIVLIHKDLSQLPIWMQEIKCVFDAELGLWKG